MSRLTPEQLADIDKRIEAMQYLRLSCLENGLRKDRKDLRQHITALEADIDGREQLEALDFSWELAKQRWYKSESKIDEYHAIIIRWVSGEITSATSMGLLQDLEALLKQEQE